MDTDNGSEIEELKQEVEELKAITQDTNRQVHKMRRSNRWALLFRIIWWLTILGVTGAAYYYYLQPYVERAMDAYNNTKDLQVQVQDWFAQFGRTGAQ